MALLVAGAMALGSAAAAARGQPRNNRIKPNEPMATGMMKPGMTKGEVKANAGKKERQMAPMMEQEQKSMPAEKEGLTK